MRLPSPCCWVGARQTPHPVSSVEWPSPLASSRAFLRGTRIPSLALPGAICHDMYSCIDSNGFVEMPLCSTQKPSDQSVARTRSPRAVSTDVRVACSNGHHVADRGARIRHCHANAERAPMAGAGRLLRHALMVVLPRQACGQSPEDLPLNRTPGRVAQTPGWRPADPATHAHLANRPNRCFQRRGRAARALGRHRDSGLPCPGAGGAHAAGTDPLSHRGRP